MLKLYLWAFTLAQLTHLEYSNWIMYESRLYMVQWLTSDRVELTPV
jgi:hypothetical protein